jgi:hypothetical protein
MNLLDLLRQFAAENTDPAGSAERIAALRDYLGQYRTEHPDETVDLAALDTDAMAAFEELRTGDLTPQALADMQALADVCDAVRELSAQDTAAADEIAQQAAALAARVTGGEPGNDDGEGDSGEGEGAPADPPADPQTDPAEGTPAEPALVAGGRRVPAVPLGRLPNHRRRANGNGPDGAAGYEWRAGADIRGIAAGAPIDSPAELVRAAQSRLQAFARTGAAGTHMGSIAVIDRSNRRDRNGNPIRAVDEELTYGDMAALTDETKLPGGSLVAAGGWCAPSEILYDLLPGADPNAGMIDVPTINARRGGIRWPTTPQFSAIYANANASFYQTEATVIAGATPKPCYEIPCNTFSEVRLGVAGVCVRSPILTERGYPELVETTTAEIMAAHAHKVNQRKIADMVAGATANTMTASDITTAGYTATLLTAIELQVEYLRYRHRWNPGTTLEMVMPIWARGTVRADIAGRNGQPIETVTDAQVAAWFATRGVAVQWVYDWQDSYATGVAGDFGGTTPPKRYPANVTALIYRAGTYFIAESDVITVDGLYDSTLLSQNMHLAYFTEEGYAVGKRDWPAIALTLPVYPGGYTGAQVDPPALNIVAAEV